MRVFDSVRFSALNAKTVNVEHHVHTTYTDGHGTIAQILDAARLRGLQSVAFTEHVRRDSTWFIQFADEVRRTAEQFAEIQVFVGCEAKVLDPDGSLDVSKEILNEVDLVLGSVHRIPDGKGGYVDYYGLTLAECADLEYRFALGLARNTQIDVLAHPGGMTQRSHGFFPEEYFRDLMMETLDLGIAIEISSSYLRDVEAFLELCGEIDPKVSVGSDVHRVDTLGACRDMLRTYLHERTLS